jgi:tripartite-type tricarboxylate transporter receptor subunit TctC
MVAPTGTPKDVVDRLQSEMKKALSDPTTRDKLVALGLTIRGTTPDELGLATREQFNMYRKLIQDNHIKAD